jgi:hypothetical protein
MDYTMIARRPIASNIGFKLIFILSHISSPLPHKHGETWGFHGGLRETAKHELDQSLRRSQNIDFPGDIELVVVGVA